MAKAYDSYNRYERIDILITDEGDDANGFAIYNFSRVVIFAPHMDWVMRNRQLWIQNVVTTSCPTCSPCAARPTSRRWMRLKLYGSTYNYKDKVNYSFQIPWIPLIAPPGTWKASPSSKPI